MQASLENPFLSPEIVPVDIPQDTAKVPEEPVTLGDWKQLGLPMQWSIFKQGTTDQENMDNWVLDMSAPVADGEYPGVYGSGKESNNPFRKLDYDGKVAGGIMVEGGKFMARPTAEAVYDLVRTFQRGRYNEIVRHGESMNHQFIERMDYNPFGGYFRVQTGS